MNKFIKETVELLDRAKIFLDKNGDKIRKSNEIKAKIKKQLESEDICKIKNY